MVMGKGEFDQTPLHTAPDLRVLLYCMYPCTMGLGSPYGREEGEKQKACLVLRGEVLPGTFFMAGY